MFAHEFMRHACLAGTFIALACGAIGYFVVLRAQVFAGDALSHVAFTGALGAAALGVDIRLGLFAATVVVGAGIGGLGERARADDVVIGIVFAWILGLGALFLSIFVSGSSGEDGTAAVRVLFGSILGLSGGEAWVAVAVALAAVAALAAIARPLLFASLDPEVAAASASPCERSASASSCSSARSPRRRPRPSAPCCCWDCWRPRPVPRACSPTGPGSASASPPRSPSARCGWDCSSPMRSTPSRRAPR